jgi:hypothetical protein
MRSIECLDGVNHDYLLSLPHISAHPWGLRSHPLFCQRIDGAPDNLYSQRVALESQPIRRRTLAGTRLNPSGAASLCGGLSLDTAKFYGRRFGRQHSDTPDAPRLTNPSAGFTLKSNR